MKKFFLSSVLVAVFAFYAVYQRMSGASYPEGEYQNQSPAIPSTVPVAVPSAGQGSVPPVIKTPSKTKNTGGRYKDGEYTGNNADAYYGNVQVKVSIHGGKITDVQFLDYPHDRRTSLTINTYAMPYLKSEAIQAQSAEVDIVSGATQTSGGFKESLATALARATP